MNFYGFEVSFTPMRYVFVALMIALLPLRGWAGQVMAVDMASEQMRAIQTAALTHAGEDAIAVMPTDCPMLAQAGADNQTAANPNCNCDTCELCLALASPRDTGLLAATFMPHSPPPDADSGFGNTDHTPGLKPPIS